MRMPVFFVGHGSPMNAIMDTPFSRSLASMGSDLPERPRAILVVSAHWLTEGTAVNSTLHPETIYDFYGFPDELYQVAYNPDGSPEVAREIVKLVPNVTDDHHRGLDHGAWTVLKHMFPQADIPVLQLSIDFYRPMQYHYDLGKRLKILREEGILVVGSGNIVHNLRLYYSRQENNPFDWALEFDEWVKTRLDERDFDALIHYDNLGKAAQLSVPTIDHYVPLIYTIALADKNEDITYTYEEVISSMSMRCLRIS